MFYDWLSDFYRVVIFGDESSFLDRRVFSFLFVFRFLEFFVGFVVVFTFEGVLEFFGGFVRIDGRVFRLAFLILV